MNPWRDLRVWLGLLVCVLAVWAHQLVLWDWVVDDAAISFAYARNFAAGDGLVAMPGGERIEGYSNPLWVLLLAGFELLGVDGFRSAKWMSLALSAACVPLAFAAARDALPAARRETPAAWLAPVFLVASSQFAIWSASGLENVLVTLLTLTAMVLLPREGRVPASALAMLGVAWTRPDGLGLAAVVGLWVLVAAVRDRTPWAPVRWAAVFWVPYGASMVARYLYFAWWLPNTWYAKVGTSGTRPLSWSARGWSQVREWAALLLHGYFLPVYLAGMVAAGRRWLRWLGPAWLMLLLVPGPAFVESWWLITEAGVPEGWLQVRIVLLVTGAMLLPATLQDAPHTRALGLAWHLVVMGLGFSVYADGDWMRGYRWMSLVVGPLAVLFSVGLDAIITQLDRGRPTWSSLGWALGTLVSVGWIPWQVEATLSFSEQPVDYPEMIKRRLDYTDAVAETLFLDEVSTLDMDMGAHMWWSDYRLVDLAGLIDIPIARHTFKDTAFMEQYLFQEQRPHFAHVHRAWARISGVPRYKAFRRDYFELPPYDDDGRKHGGVHLRRDVFMEPTPDAMAHQFEAVTIHEVRVPSPRVDAYLYVEVLTSSTRPHSLTLVADGPERKSWDLVPGHGWLPPEQWDGQAFRGRYAVDVRGLELGVYSLSLVSGEQRWPVEVSFERATAQAVQRQVRSRLDDVVEAAAKGECEQAETHLERAWQHRPRLHRGVIRDQGRQALAQCWGERSADTGGHEALVRARWWSRVEPAVVELCRSRADALMAEGLQARADADWAVAYRAFRRTLELEPHRAFARRYAEEARDALLATDEGATGPSRPRRP